MAGGRASTRTSYKEADSDDDWLAGVEPGATKVFEDLPLVKGVKGKAGGAKVRKRVGDTYGAGPRKKARKSKGKGKEKAKEDEDASPFSLDLLFRLPDDLFLEICGYLDGRDLLEFSRTCKTMRKTLFSAKSGYIWANSRRHCGLPLPTGMTELELASLVFGEGCQVCGDKDYFERDYFLRFRSCRSCRKTWIIAASKLRRGWPDLHPSATCCVPGYDEGISTYSGRQQTIWYLVTDLAEAHSQLLKLEEQDELARFTSSREAGRKANVADAELGKSFVLDYVQVKKEEVAQKVKEAKGLRTACRMHDQHRWAEGWERDRPEREAKEVQRKLRHEQLLDKFGWTPEQLEWLKGGEVRARRKPPAAMPTDDPDGWTAYQAYIQKALDREAAEARRESAKRARIEALKYFHKQYCENSDLDTELLPTLRELVQLPPIKPWLEETFPVYDSTMWDERRGIADDALEDFHERLRVAAIRSILSATSGIAIKHLSNDSSSYPEDKYDSAFFSRPTSIFFGEMRKSELAGMTVFYPLPFVSSLLEHKASTYRTKAETLSKRIDERQVIFVRCILAAAGLEETSAKSHDLNLLGHRFRWTNHPSHWKSKREKKMNWVETLYAMLSRGPKLADLKAGDLPEIELVPSEDDGENLLDDEADSDEDSSGSRKFGSDTGSGGGSDSDEDLVKRGRYAGSSDEEMEDEEDYFEDGV